MKTLMRSFTALTLMVCAVSTFAAEKEDPIVGTWRWFNNQKVTVTQDGKFTSTKDGDGKWEFVNSNEVERKYKFYWGGGVSIDTVSLSRDAAKLSGKNLAKKRISAERIPEEAPAKQEN